MNKEDGILEPGSDIKPPITSTEQIIPLAERLYGIKVEKINEMNAYDDKNYHLIVSEKIIKNPHLQHVWSHGYVFKVMNSLDSNDLQFVDAQNQLMLYINSKGINTTEPIKNMDGKYYSQEPFENKNTGVTSNHVVRLLIYQPGMILKNVKGSLSVLSNLYYDVGLKAAILNNHMKEFYHGAYNKRTSLWQLTNVMKVKEFLFAVKDNEKINMILDVLEEFEKLVLKNENNLQRGLIHGDLNESNILVNDCKNNDCDKTDDYKVSAIIDYGDSHVSAYVLELAITICYMLIHSKCLESAAFIVEGYHKINPLTISEYKLLPICVGARLCQSLVLGLYTHSLDPANNYVLTTQEAGWNIFYELTSKDRDQINNIWMKNIV